MTLLVQKSSLKSSLEAGIGFFYPNRCQLCDSESATADEGYVGIECWRSVRFIKPPFCECCGLPYEGEITTSFECGNCREMDLHFQAARASVVAGKLVLEVIHRYKYQRALWFEPFLADLLIRAARPLLASGNWDLIIPVPLHPLKQREREFNQAERLALRLSAATRIPVNARLLRRVEPTRTQTQLSREQRAANVRNAFAMRRKRRLNGERVILVDDVLTTGATADACARALRGAGARTVTVLTVGRTP